MDLAAKLATDPQSFENARYNEGFTLTNAARESAQLAALQLRFNSLKPRLTALAKVAEEQGVTRIDAIEDVVPLLFPHTVYKSYPLSFLEQGRFDRLTKWLGSLTTTDLTKVDLSGVDTIDGWIQALEKGSDLAPIHTFGTSGKLSIIPRTKEHLRVTVTVNARCIRDFNGADSGPDLLVNHMPLIAPSYRHGASSIARGMKLMADLYGKGEALFLYPDAYFSADVASLAGRLRAAEARGEAGQLQLPPSLIARRAEFAAREAQRGQDMDNFFNQASERFAGRDVFLFAVWPILFEWAEEGLKRGIKGVFGPNSVLTSGGGSKGKVLPPDYKERIFEFLGFERHMEFFGMSELMANAPRCAHNRFHFPPVVIPFVLDPETGESLPRTGRQTGRLALMDLLPDSYWGGFVSGDRVTMGGFDEPCACGRTGLYIDADIQRFSDLKNGDDKINCAGAPEAHDRAVEFLLDRTA
jgi:hypothetical protein